MPRTNALPKYRKHRASGQAVVTLSGHDFYLGPHNTKASKLEYDRLVAQWLQRGGRERSHENGTVMRGQRCLVDANGVHSDEINQPLRRSKLASLLVPSYGTGMSARKAPISRCSTSRKQRCGPEWAHTKLKTGQLRGVVFDTSRW